MQSDQGFLVTGIPGAGKTTVSRLLAAHFDRGVHMEADTLHRLIVKGGLWPDQEPKVEAYAQLDLRAKNAALLANNFRNAGFTVVVDDVIVGRDRLSIYENLFEHDFRLIVLAPTLKVALDRAENRGYQRVGSTWAHLDKEQREKLGGCGIWIDNSSLKPEQTVKEILKSL